jgi:hypothetical protein
VFSSPEGAQERYLFRPFRAEEKTLTNSLSQGVALGYFIAPLQGEAIVVRHLRVNRSRKCVSLHFRAPSAL